MTDWSRINAALSGYPVPVPDQDGFWPAMECPVRGCDHGIAGEGTPAEFRESIHRHMGLEHRAKVATWWDPARMEMQWRLVDAPGR
jgi:hypothetical protein